MGNVDYLGIPYANILGIGQPATPGYLPIERTTVNQIKNIENKQAVRLLRKRKFRNVEYI